MNRHRRRQNARQHTPMIWMVSSLASRELYGEPYLLSQDEVAHRLSISRTTVWRLLKDGELESVRIGARTFVSKSSLDQFLIRHTSGRSE
ncbi:helix-turn-helix domain-containing protein [Cryobacterium zongtaii]|nr:helix-turn-helix domain-containing protein [Cryobacterium zongtaii]